MPYRPLSNEIDPPYGVEHTTPSFAVVTNLIVAILLLCIFGVVAWTILR